jgi:hypothetical protein
MFPVISVGLRGLDPGRLYSVWLHLTAADDPTLTLEKGQTLWDHLHPETLGLRLPPPVRPYMHPFSPMRGLAWMKVKVAFNNVKLTSDDSLTDAAYVSTLR